MKYFSALVLVLLLGAGAYAYHHNPQGCVKLGNDIRNDLPKIREDLLAIVAKLKAQQNTQPTGGSAPPVQTSH